MSTTKYSDRVIPSISLANFDQRIEEITAQLVDAAENVGFFSIVDHGIARTDVDKVFEFSSSFFSLPDEVKSLVPFSPIENIGWEKNAQIRPSTGACDRKESYQLQFNSGMETRWLPETIVPGFRSTVMTFMHQAQAVSEKLMVCFARGLGFPDDFFVAAHDITKEDSQTVARLLHYFAAPEASNDGQIYHRAGAHTDWDFITLLFQKAGQSGLEICPGREAASTFGHSDVWTRVEPAAESNAIICNIGDLLMSWSDDRFKSTLHRVKAPCEPGDFYGERYSIAFFNQPRKSAEIQGPGRKYPLVTGAEFTRIGVGIGHDHHRQCPSSSRSLSLGCGRKRTAPPRAAVGHLCRSSWSRSRRTLGCSLSRFAELYGLGSDMELILMRHRPYDLRSYEFSLETYAIRRVLEHDEDQEYSVKFHLAADEKVVESNPTHSLVDSVEGCVHPHRPSLVELF
ncbi:oxidoreductase domain containing [Cordyceps militaris]|uniref:Oxidoreductase domain containing n=1 Tax=Cordyceps militaris TaxID=73501 RepID=A0A2H4SE09_CORMI|nr:oxidoreductase domain containing [Cordyceps militaris]